MCCLCLIRTGWRMSIIRGCIMLDEFVIASHHPWFKEKNRSDVRISLLQKKHGKLHNPSLHLVPLSPIASLGLWLSEKNIMGRVALRHHHTMFVRFDFSHRAREFAMLSYW